MEVAAKLAIVDKYVECFATSNIEIIKEIYADEATVEDPVGSEKHVGIAAITAFYEGAMAMGVRLELTGTPRCTGNAVAFPFKVKIGDSMEIDVIDVFEFNDKDKIVSMKAYWGPDNTVNK